MLILQYKASFTCDRPGRCFRFVYIYACIAVFFFVLQSRFSVNKDFYIRKKQLQLLCANDTVYSPIYVYTGAKCSETL